MAPDKTGAAAHLAKGKDLQENEQFGEAVKELREAVKCDPNDAEAHARLAAALQDNDERNQALAEIEIAVKLAPDDANKTDQYVQLLEELGMYEKALVPEKKLLTLRPKDATLRRQASWLFEQTGDQQTALSLMREAVKLDPDLEKGWYNLAALLNDMGKTTDAMQTLKDGLKRLPEASSLYYEMGLLLSSSKHPTAAIEPLKKAIALDEEDDEARELLQRLTKAAGKPLYLVKLQKVGMSFFAEVVINEKVRTKLVVDSGATSVAINNDVAKRAGENIAAAPEVNFDSATGHAVAHEVILKSLRVGDAKISNVKALVHDMPSQNGETGLLGMSFLSHFKTTLDAEHSELWLTKP